MEQFSNNGSALLNNGGTLTSGATTTVVTSAVNVPSSGTFRVLIGTELIKVTAVSGSTWTIVRGDDGTSAASHVDGDTAYVVVTKSAMNALVSVQSVDSEVANRRILDFGSHLTVTDDSGNSRIKIDSCGSVHGEVLTAPVIGNFTFDGHSITGTPTATQQGNSIYLYHPGTNSDSNIELYITAPATPYSIVAKVIPFGLGWAFTSMGLYFGDGTKLQRLVCQLNVSQVVVDKYTNSTTFSANDFAQSGSFMAPVPWLKVRDDATHKTFHISPDGVNWMQVYSGTSTEHLATTTRVGVALNGNTGGNNTGRVAGLILQSWQQGV